MPMDLRHMIQTARILAHELGVRHAAECSEKQSMQKTCIEREGARARKTKNGFRDFRIRELCLHCEAYWCAELCAQALERETLKGRRTTSYKPLEVAPLVGTPWVNKKTYETPTETTVSKIFSISGLFMKAMEKKFGKDIWIQELDCPEDGAGTGEVRVWPLSVVTWQDMEGRKPLLEIMDYDSVTAMQTYLHGLGIETGTPVDEQAVLRASRHNKEEG